MEHLEAQGARVPALGLGTWQLRGEKCRDAIRHAIELGYRHLDTARAYGNEADVGGGIADAEVDRDEIFLVTKLPSGSLDRGSVADGVDSSLEQLGTDHLDLLLIHHPETWEVGPRWSTTGSVLVGLVPTGCAPGASGTDGWSRTTTAATPVTPATTIAVSATGTTRSDDSSSNSAIQRRRCAGHRAQRLAQKVFEVAVELGVGHRASSIGVAVNVASPCSGSL